MRLSCCWNGAQRRGDSRRHQPSAWAEHRGVRRASAAALLPGGRQGPERDARQPLAPARGGDRAIRRALRGERFVAAGEAFAIERSLPAGHVRGGAGDGAAARAGAAARPRALARARAVPGDDLSSRRCGRAPSSPPRARSGSRRSAHELGVAGADEDDLYAALDWLLERQAADRGARSPAATCSDGELGALRRLLDLLRGPQLPAGQARLLARRRRGTLQIVYGLLCDRRGRPIAIEVFSGELHDDKTLPAQIEKLKTRFGLETVIVVCDRGMVTKANLELMAETDGVGWITALKAPQIKKLVTRRRAAAVAVRRAQPGRDRPPRTIRASGWSSAATRSSPPSARASARSCSRRPSAASSRSPSASSAARSRGADQIGLAVGRALKRYRVKKHFEVEITDDQLQLPAQGRADRRRGRARRLLRAAHQRPRRDAARPPRSCAPTSGSKQVERAFGTFKGPELEIRPIHHRLEDRVRAHVLLCMLAYYLDLAPAPGLGASCSSRTSTRRSPPTRSPRPARSPAAQRKAQTKRTTAGEPCHSYRSLLAELATLHPQHDPPPRHRRHLRQAHRAHPTPGPRARTRRHRRAAPVVTTAPTPADQPSTQANPAAPSRGTSA